jgi:hypothetical protein
MGTGSFGRSAPAKSESTVFVFNSFNIATISGGQIYFFEITDQPIMAQGTNISLLNAQEFKTADWSSGSLSTTTLTGLDNYDNKVGDLLRDALRPVIVTASNEHPGFGSSSSETTLSSDSSQSNSSLSESSSSSEMYSESTSSEGYSESSSSSEGYSESSSSEGYSESSSSSEGYSESSSSSEKYSESSSSSEKYSESSSSEGYSESSSSFVPMVHIYYKCYPGEGANPSAHTSSSSSSDSSEGYSESSSSSGIYSSSSSSLEVYFEYEECLGSESSESSSSSTSSEIYSSSSEGLNNCVGLNIFNSKVYEEYQGDFIRICDPITNDPIMVEILGDNCCWEYSHAVTLEDWLDICGDFPEYSDPNDIVELPSNCFTCLFSDSSDSSMGYSESSSSESINFGPCVSPCDLTVEFKTFTIPDGLKVYDNTGLQLDTGLISTGGTYNVYNFTDLECPVVVCVNAPSSGTGWALRVNGCGMDIDTSGGQVAEKCFVDEDENHLYIDCELFTESISSQSESSESSSSEGNSESSSSFDPMSESSSSDGPMSESSSSENYSESSSSEGAVVPLDTCPGETSDPKIKITMTWADAPSTRKYFGQTWESGEAKLICPVSQYSNFGGPTVGYERWRNFNTSGSGDAYGSANGLELFCQNGVNRARIRITQSGGGTPNFLDGGDGANGDYTLNTSTMVPAQATISTVFTGGPPRIPDSFFGHLTRADGLTMKWERVVGSGGDNCWKDTACT